MQFSGGFDDPEKLMAACERLGHEGIVSKHRDSAYRPGRSKEWLKTQTAPWKAANRNRFELISGKIAPYRAK